MQAWYEASRLPGKLNNYILWTITQ